MTPGHPHEKKKQKLITLTAVTLLALTLLSCDITWTAVTPSVTAPPASTEEPATPGSFTATPYSQWLQIYFTDPLAAGAKNYEGGPDVPLVKAIDASRLSIEVAAYDLNLWSIRDALIQAEKRGVTVRMVMESDNMDEPEVGDLKTAGIPIVGDQREALMHDKYIIIDRTQVWTGSMNFTAGGTYRDNNNLICIQSAQAVENYTVDFNEMFSENRFGTDGTVNTPNPELTIDGTPVQFYFSPDDGVAAHILDLINAATESVHFLAYAFTSDDIGQAIIARAQAGLEVRGVVDVSQSSQEGAEFETLKAAGVNVHLDGNPRGLMHNKVIIIDRSIVITGSYNFTAAAEDKNDENLVVINNEAAAFKYMDEFEKIFNEAQP
jgi:phosphatidylserine/phosphatidylglycerophosphate/cardiolipin synthase-like enzyme